MDDFATVTIDGNYPGTYEFASNYAVYLQSGTLYNTGSSTIYLYPVGHTDNYPRIQISSLGHPYYYSGNNYNGVAVTGISSTEFNVVAQAYRFVHSPIYSLVLVATLTLSLFFKAFRRH